MRQKRVFLTLLFRASVLIQFIYEDLDFQSPFFVTYIATSLLSLHIPAWYVTRYVKNYLYPNTNQQMPEDLRALMSTTSSFQNLIPMSMGESNIPDYVSPQHWEMIKIAMVISPLWFGANCFYNYSLLMTTVSSSTIIRYVYYNSFYLIEYLYNSVLLFYTAIYQHHSHWLSRGSWALKKSLC